MFKLAGSYRGDKIEKLSEETVPFPIITICAAAGHLEANGTPQGSAFTQRVADRLPPLDGKIDLKIIYDRVYRHPSALLALRYPTLMTSFHKMKTITLD